MCLDKIRPPKKGWKEKKNTEYVGYVVAVENTIGDNYSPVYQHCNDKYEAGEWYEAKEAKKKVVLPFKGPEPMYRGGFHIFHTLTGARRYVKDAQDGVTRGRYARLVILKVAATGFLQVGGVRVRINPGSVGRDFIARRYRHYPASQWRRRKILNVVERHHKEEPLADPMPF